MAPLDDFSQLDQTKVSSKLAAPLLGLLPEGTNLVWITRTALHWSGFKSLFIPLLGFKFFMLLLQMGVELGNRNRGAPPTDAVWETFVELFFMGLPVLLAFYVLTKLVFHAFASFDRYGASSTHLYIKRLGHPLQSYALANLKSFDIQSITPQKLLPSIEFTQKNGLEGSEKHHVQGDAQTAALLQQLHEAAAAASE